MAHKPFYEFGPFRLDVALNRLERAGARIPLPPKAFDLLVLLAQNTDRIMAKGELIETLWHDTFVEEGNLTQHIYTLRKALGDHADGRPYIETVPRRGYRLTAEVREGVNAAPLREGGAAASPTPVVRDDERKYATVMYCAVADAAAIVERYGSAMMHEVMDRVLAIAEDEIRRYDGVISQRHADGFVAVFGAAVVHEDDGRRAILSGLALERRVSRLELPAGSDELRLDLRIGIDAGPLVISRIADAQHTEYSAVGETMRAADLLHQFAGPGTILISEPVWRTADRHIAAEELLPAPAGQRAFRVVGPLRAGAGVRQPRRTLVTFRGRLQETALLTQLGRQALAGSGQVVGIVGEAGMGKSRLVYEFTRAIGEQSDVVTLEGRCVSYGSLVPYLPLVDLLRAHVAADVTDAPDVIREAVDAAVRENGLAADAGGWLLRLMGHSDGRTAVEPASPEAIKARTFDVLRLLFIKAARRRPLVIVVEDLHWIDRTSEEFLATLVERLVGARIILLATHRPGYRAPWLDRSYVTQITLGPLTASDSVQIVQSIAQDSLDREVCRAILDRGEGNPFFLEELARSVAERGAGEERIPETIQGVIMARLDRLADPAKRLLQIASVLGREVPLRELEPLAHGGDLDVPLADLCRQEFLFERAGGDERVFAFKHALTQDVAYDSLLSRRRRELHVEAARVLEELYRDRLEEITATLAYHYARTDLIDESVTWLVRAAERAARVYANTEAVLHLDLAARRLQRLPEGADRDRRMLDVALRHAHSLYFLGRFRESVEVLQPHEARVARLDDAAVTGAYTFWLAHMYSRLGDQPRAEASARRAIAAATSAGDLRTVGKAHGLLALEGHWRGRPKDGIAHGRMAVNLLQPHLDQQWWLGMAHSYLAMNHLLLGDFEDALSDAAQADRIGQQIGDPRLQTYAGFITAWVEASRGNAEAASVEARRSLERAPDRVSRAYATLFLAFARLEQGAHDDACRSLGELIPEFEGFGIPQFHALAAALRAEALRRQGQLEDANRLITHGLALAGSANYQYAIGFAQRTAGRIARDQGRAEEAATRFAEAVSTFERIGARFEARRPN